jgi:hypothetical protein
MNAENVGRLLASKKPLDNIPGGEARGRSPSEFDSRMLRKAIDVEKEHTPVIKKRVEIGMDHETEFPGYYKDKNLPAFERKLEREKKAFSFSGGRLRPISKLMKPKGLKTII